MAALRYDTNWDDTFQPEMNSDTNFLAQQETKLFPDQFFNYDGFECFSDSHCNDIDILFDPNDLFYSENCNISMFPQLPYNNNLPTSLSDYTLNTPLVDFEPFQTLKRQKVVYDNYEPFYSDNQLINPSLTTLKGGLQDNYQLEFVLPEFAAPPVYRGGSYEAVTKPPPAASSGGSLSAQSAAARQRRRKITEKTRELGKLIPGGQKMNTAEMLQSAYKYIQFLQAEVGILEFMSSFHHQENKDSELLHGFIVSPLIQEKLYSTEKCLVPEKFVRLLASGDVTFDSKPNELLREIKELKRN